MNSFTLTYRTENFRDGKRGYDNHSVDLELPSEVSEITLRQWVKYQELAKDAPAHIEKEDNATFVDWLQFISFAKAVLELFSGKDLSRALAGISAQPNAQNGIVAMYTGVVSLVAGYEPKERESFEWKGATYVLPETIQQSFGQMLVGGNLSVMEATDALDIEHVFGQKNADGTPAIEDAKYHNDIALVASICRKVKQDETLEMPPMDFIQRRQWFDRRLELFADLPMDIALDVAFFLIGSNSVSKSIRLSAMLLNRSSTRPRPEKPLRPISQSGKRGGGIPSSTR